MQTQANALIIAFSVYTNGEKLFDMTRSKSKNSIDCINGLRVLSLMWIMFGHRLGLQFGTSTTNWKDFNDWIETAPSTLFTIFHVGVDTFFVIGGLLTTITFLNALDS